MPVDGDCGDRVPWKILLPYVSDLMSGSAKNSLAESGLPRVLGSDDVTSEDVPTSLFLGQVDLLVPGEEMEDKN